MTALTSSLRPLRRQIWLRRHATSFAEPSPRPRPRLLVDVSNILQHDAQTGIQRVVRAIWSELQRRDGGGFELRPVYANHHHGYCHAPADPLGRPALDPMPEPVTMAPGDRFLGLDLAAQYVPKYRAQLRSWRAAGGTLHFLVYDLLPLLRPDWFSDNAHRNFRAWLRVLANDSDQLLCISRQVVRDVREQLRKAAAEQLPDVAHIPLGGDIDASVPTRGLTDELSLLLARLPFRPALLMVGTIEPRKGYDVALDAFQHLWETQGADAPDLVIVGQGGWKTRQLQDRLRTHPEAGKRLHWLEAVSDEGLAALYERCRGLVMASHAEGFGLPLIEAAGHGCLVLARDLPVFQEQDLPNVRYFGDDRKEHLAPLLVELAQAGKSRPASLPGLPTWRESVDDLISKLGLAPEQSAEWVEARGQN